MRIRITDSFVDTNKETGEQFLDVRYDIVSDTDEVLASRSEGFAVNTEPEAIHAYMQKALDTFIQDNVSIQRTVEQEEVTQKATEVADGLKGFEIESDIEEPSPVEEVPIEEPKIDSSVPLDTEIAPNIEPTVPLEPELEPSN
jgi:hypothetical protein